MKLKKIFVPNHPDLQDATVTDLRVSVGQKIKYNHFIVRLIQTNGVSIPILSPYAGIIRKVVIKLGEHIVPSALILWIEVDTALACEDEEERTPENEIDKERIFDKLVQDSPVDVLVVEQEEEKPISLDKKKIENIDPKKIATEKALVTNIGGSLFVHPNKTPTNYDPAIITKTRKFFNITLADAAKHQFQKEQQRKTVHDGDPLNAATTGAGHATTSPASTDNLKSGSLFSKTTSRNTSNNEPPPNIHNPRTGK